MIDKKTEQRRMATEYFFGSAGNLDANLPFQLLYTHWKHIRTYVNPVFVLLNFR